MGGTRDAPRAGVGAGDRADEGAYLVLYALLAVAVFAIVALVLDIALLRQDRRTSRTAADAAVTAGATKLVGGSAIAACTDAWGYFLANRADTSGTVSAPDCAVAFAAPCDPGLTRPPAVGTAGDFRVEISNPVPNNDPLMRAEAPGGDASQTLVPDSDGTDPCDRLGVRILRTRALAFAGIAGLSTGRTDVHSVAWATDATPTGNATAMVVLDPTGCNALTTTGGGQLTATGLGAPGVISVDSDGTACGANAYTIDPDNAGSITVTNGVIRSYAGFVNPPKAYDPADVNSARLSPAPTPTSTQTGRAPVDARYGGAVVAASTQYGSGAPAGLIPYPDPLNPLESCVVPTGRTLALANRYVDCDTLTIRQGGKVTFMGTVVVFRGGIDIDGSGQGGCLAFNSPICGLLPAQPLDSLVFVRSGNIVKGDHGQLGLGQATLILAGGGAINIDGGTGSSALSWTAPLAGAFEDLALWTETPALIAVSGQQSGFLIEGLLFAPSTSEFLLRPKGGARATAQLVARRVRVDGGNQAFEIGPDPLRAVQDLARAVKLIR